MAGALALNVSIGVAIFLPWMRGKGRSERRGLGMVRIFSAAALATLAMAYAEPSVAACSCQCVNGSQQQLCSSSIDLPAICAPTICPIAAPSIAPIQSPVIPPLGASRCRQAQVATAFGYQWQTVCQ